MPNPFPYQEISHERLSEIAVNLARERDRLVVRLAVYEERFGHLDHAPLLPAHAGQTGMMRRGEWVGAPIKIGQEATIKGCSFGTDYDHLVEKRRAAEGADMPAEAEPKRWHIGKASRLILALSIACWLGVVALAWWTAP